MRRGQSEGCWGLYGQGDGWTGRRKAREVKSQGKDCHAQGGRQDQGQELGRKVKGEEEGSGVYEPRGRRGQGEERFKR